MTNRRDWIERVTGDVIAKGHIQQLYQRLYPMATGIGRVGGKRTAIDDYDARQIVEVLESRSDGGPLVTREQAEQGADWLVRYGERLGLPAAIIGQRPLFFRFPRCVDRQGPTGRGEFWLPEYVAHYDDGSVLRYSTGAWQSQTAQIEFTYQEVA